jgi:hypothetical protein
MNPIRLVALLALVVVGVPTTGRAQDAPPASSPAASQSAPPSRRTYQLEIELGRAALAQLQQAGVALQVRSLAVTPTQGLPFTAEA